MPKNIKHALLFLLKIEFSYTYEMTDYSFKLYIYYLSNTYM